MISVAPVSIIQLGRPTRYRHGFFGDSHFSLLGNARDGTRGDSYNLLKLFGCLLACAFIIVKVIIMKVQADDFIITTATEHPERNNTNHPLRGTSLFCQHFSGVLQVVLGAIIFRDMTWGSDIDCIMKRAQHWMYVLPQLRKFNLHRELMVQFCTAIIFLPRPSLCGMGGMDWSAIKL